MLAPETTLIQTWAKAIQTPRLRTISEFAEQEIVLPDGPYIGRRFRLNRHPISRLLFNELDSGRWRRVFVTGPNQDGKSLIGFVIVTLYLLFERLETVILGVPSMDMVADKWTVDLLPTIKASRYRDLLPKSGKGSRDGAGVLYEFGNGARLRFMTGGGDDQSRASFTSSNLVVTETDGFDVVGSSSREGTKFDQLERRTLAYGDRARIIAECTVSTEAGRTWQEYQRGSASRIAIRCPHCREWVSPEREHFGGWQDTDNEVDAAKSAHLCCPNCGAAWTEEERIEANRDPRLVHKGQQIATDGTIVGTMPPTQTLGFRWSVANTILTPGRLRKVAVLEWRAKRAANEDAADRDICQSQWAIPARPARVDVSQLDAFVIMRRTIGLARGICPEQTQCVTVGLDVGKRLCHWTAIAWRPGATPHVVDYGRLEVPSDTMDESQAILLALRDFRDEMEGWKCGDRIIRPTFVFVDAGNWQDVILQCIAESGPPFFATKGYGFGQRREGNYKRDTGSKVIGARDGYALVQLPDARSYVEVQVDRWKSWLHARLHTPIDQPGALTLFESNEHLSFAKHLTSEKQIEEFSPSEGVVIRWEAVSRINHWLDATTLACVAGSEAGMRLIESPAAVAPPKQSLPPEQDESGRWLPDRPQRWMK